MFNALLAAITAAILTVGAFLGIYQPQANFDKNEIEELVKVNVKDLWDFQLGATNLAALHTYNLSGSGVTSSATSFTLTSLILPQNDYKIHDSDLSDTFYLTLEPGNKTRQEIVSCTNVVQNAGG